MKTRGFTLIELLAVIVILAIIALIATPIILNIISDTKESANKRSIELYGKAVENAVGNYQVKYPEDTDITFDKIQEYIKYKGNTVECATNINKDATVYLSGCKVDGKDVEYTYGKPETIAMYRWSRDPISIGDTIDPTEFTTDPTTLGKDAYLKHVIDKDNKVKESYACAVLRSKEYCLTVGEYGYAENESEYTGNALILKSIQEQSGLPCIFYDYAMGCPTGPDYLGAHSDGYVRSYDDTYYCSVYDNGSSYCSGS